MKLHQNNNTLYFQNTGIKALELYKQLFPEFILSDVLIDNEKLQHANIQIQNQNFVACDTDFSITSSLAINYTFQDETAFDFACKQLSQAGIILSTELVNPLFLKYCWLVDEFDVHWKLALRF